MLLPPGGRRRNQINGWMSAAAAARSSYATLAQFKWEPVERAMPGGRRWCHLASAGGTISKSQPTAFFMAVIKPSDDTNY